MAYIDKAKTVVWETPHKLFDALNERYHFTLDPCALPENAKCKKFFTPEDDGLSQNWGGAESVLQSSVWTGAGRMGKESL